MEQKIKTAALKLFLKYGPKRTTINDIIWELQISKKAFYQYFSNKNDLVNRLFKGVVEDAALKMWQLADREKQEMALFIKWQYRYYKYLKGYSVSCSYELNKYYPEVVDVYNHFRKNVVFKGLMQVAKSAQQKDILRKDVDLGVFVKMQIYSLEELLFGRFNLTNSPTEQEENRLADHIIINNVRGAVLQSYIDRFDQIVSSLKMA